MRCLRRFYHRVVAHLCWFDLGLLKKSRRSSARLVIALELELQKPMRKGRRANLEHDLIAERRFLAGIDAAIRITNEEATRAAMRGMV